MSFIDDHTHFAMLFLMKRKSEVFARFREYEAMVTAKFNLKISKLTIDQGREYLSNDQKQFYLQKGIQIEPTVAYTPQQNGVAERFNRTIVEKVRTMLIASHVPKTLWSEAVLTAVYLVNRSPTVALSRSSTPAEYWFNEKPSLDKLRVFGCKAFAWVPGQQRKKLDAKSKETIMVGYAPNGYRLWDRKSRRIVIARDVKFNETCFPYEKSPEKHENGPLVVVPYEQEWEVTQDANEPLIEDRQDREGTPEVPRGSREPLVEAEDAPVADEGDDSDEDYTGALPSQLEQLESDGQATLRRSERERRLPGKLLNFFTGYRATSVGSFSTDAPQRYCDIGKRSDWTEWMKAIDDELRSMEANGVWKMMPCPRGVKPLKSRWIFRVKEDEDGQAVRYKARLVAKGYLQRHGVDFEETYAPVAKLSTVRTVLAVGVHKQFHFHQMDVKTAFLHGDLKEDIFMEVPEGVETVPNMACKLLKSLYGLQQSPRCWNEKFNSQLVKLGFKRSRHNYCLYTRCDADDELYIVLYVDDLLIAGRKLESIVRLKKQLSKVFCMTDCGEARHFLGMKMVYDRKAGVLQLSQQAHVEKVVEKFGLAECNPAKSPMEKGLQLQREGKPTDQPYRELLGSLMYIMLCVRPDICFPVGYLGRYQQNPTEAHWQSLKRVVRYLKGSAKTVLKFQRNDAEPLIGFADADWAADSEDRKSVSGYVFKVFGSTVSWCSKKQTTVAISSSESEYVALSAATAEALWLAGILEDMKVKDPEAPVTIFEDNRGCIGMANNLETKRSKHIDVKHHFIRDHIAEGRIQVEPVGTQDQLADIFTKALDPGRVQELRKYLGLHD